MSKSASLSATLYANTSHFSAGLRTASGNLSKFQKQAYNTSSKTVAGFQSMNRAALSLGGVLATVFSGRELIQAADKFTALEQRIINVTNSGREATQVMRDLFRVAQRDGSNIETLAETFTKLNVSLTDNVKEQYDLVRVTDILSRGLAASGASAQTASGTILQLTQGLATNFQAAGQELNSLIEGAPLLAKVIAQELGGNAAVDLKRFAEEGQLTAESFLMALMNAEKAVKSFELPNTISLETQRLRNEFVKLVGSADDATGASTKLIGILAGLRGFLPSLGLEIKRLSYLLKKAEFRLNSFGDAAYNFKKLFKDDKTLSIADLEEELQRAIATRNKLGKMASGGSSFLSSVPDRFMEAQKRVEDLQKRIDMLKRGQSQQDLYPEFNNELEKTGDEYQKLTIDIQGLINAKNKDKETDKLTKEQKAELREALKAERTEIKNSARAMKEYNDNLRDIRQEGIDMFIDGLANGENAMQSFRQTAVSTLQDVLKSLLSLQMGGEAKGGLAGTFASKIFSSFGGYSQSGSPYRGVNFVPIGSYATGIDKVPYDMTARIHKGEAVLTAREVQNLEKRGDGYNINIDARGADAGVEQKIRNVMNDVMALRQQVPSMAVQSVASESKKNPRFLR